MNLSTIIDQYVHEDVMIAFSGGSRQYTPIKSGS